MRTYAAIVMAAGLSRRMGKFKPLLSIGGETFVDRLISVFTRNGVEVCLVVGSRAAELKAAVRGRNVVIVDNPDFARGMFTSVQVGVRSLSPGYEAFFVMPVDIPLIRPFTIRRLITASAQRPGTIIYPAFGMKRGHPPLIPTCLAPVIAEWNEDGGLRDVLDSCQTRAVEVSVPDSNILLDVDTADDYRLLVERFQRYEVPTEEECDVILREVCGVSRSVYAHSCRVAEVAQAVGEALLSAGQKADLAVIRAAAMLHHVDGGQADSDTACRLTLREMGFGRIEEVVSLHAGPAGEGTGTMPESRVLRLAHDLVEGESLAPIEKRLHSYIERAGSTAVTDATVRHSSPAGEE